MNAEQLGAAAGGLEDVGEGSEALFSSDQFRMTAMKVLPCSKRFVHDWTECPFAHPQEKARRRDPRVHNYTGIACPSMKKEGCCAFGDHCPYAHNVFEYWLHPTRYRTQLCNDGSNCKRRICFFAHSLDELRVPACKPFVSPEALASAAASAAADAEAKRKAATIGSPLSAFASLSPGPSPQRSSLDALRGASQAAAEVRLSGASVAAPASPTTTDEGHAGLGSSPAGAGRDSTVQQALQQLSGAGFSTQEQQVIELVTSLLAQDKVSPEQAASILQQMLPPGTLTQLQAHLTTPRASMDEGQRYSDPLSQRMDSAPLRSSGYEAQLPPQSPHFAAAAAAQYQQQQQQAPTAAAQSLENMAAMHAAQSLGLGYPGSVQLASQMSGGALAQEAPRMSLDSLRSSFDTGAVPATRSSSGGSEDSVGAAAGRSSQPGAAAGGAAVRSSGGSPEPAQEGAARNSGAAAAAEAAVAASQAGPQQRPRPSVDAALRRMSAEQAVGSASQQQAALAAAAQQQHQRMHHAAVVAAMLQKQQQQQHQRDRAALEAALQQRRQLLQLQQVHHQQLLLQQHLQQQAAAVEGVQYSEDSSRMSFDMAGRGSMDMLGTPRASVDAAYPPTLLPTMSGSYPGQSAGEASVGPATPDHGDLFRRSSSEGLTLRRSLSGRPARYYSGQLSSVPEQFPMINAPPPSSSWSAGAGRFSLDSAADRLSEDLNRLSFEACARAAPQPTANPYTSSFFAPSGSAPDAGMADRRSLSLPPLPPVRTSAPAKIPGMEEEEAVAAVVAQQQAQQQQQQLLGGTALQRLQ